MAKSRKTVEVEKLIAYANGYLSSDWQGGDADTEKCRRQGMIDMLEAALFAAGRYRGFVYLNQKQITRCNPGIRVFEDGSHAFFDTDQTRRSYV